MNIQATEIKAGQTIKYGNIWGIAKNDAEQCEFRKNEIAVPAEIIPGSIRRNGRIEKYEGGLSTFYYRKTTMVQVR